DHRDRAQRPVPEPDAVDDLGEPDDRDRERDREADHDPEWSPPPASRAGGQQRRQDRQHARRQGGTGPGDQREQEKQRHVMKVRTRWLQVRYVGCAVGLIRSSLMSTCAGCDTTNITARATSSASSARMLSGLSKKGVSTAPGSINVTRTPLSLY